MLVGGLDKANCSREQCALYQFSLSRSLLFFRERLEIAERLKNQNFLCGSSIYAADHSFSQIASMAGALQQVVTLQLASVGCCRFQFQGQRVSSLSSLAGHKQLSLTKLAGITKTGRYEQTKVYAGLQSAESVTKPSIVQETDWNALSTELSEASPFDIVRRALQTFGNDIAIAFSGAEDVALIEYAHLTGLPFRVFSLETGRLNPETLQLFADVEKRYNLHIEYMFPDAADVEALVRAKGLFSFYEDGHQECCGVRKVKPLRRALKGLRSWITGQRKDQSPGTRSNVPVVQVDPAFEGLDGGPGSLLKWNPLTNVTSAEVWNFLMTMDVPVNALHAKGYVSIGCEPCTKTVLPGQHEREGRWWWEDATAKECGLHKGNLSSLDNTEGDAAGSGSTNGGTIPDIFTGENITTLTRPEIESLISQPRDKASLVVLYAPWCQFSQVMEPSFTVVSDILKESPITVAKFNADGDQKAFAKERLQLKSYPTILFLPKGTDVVVKYPSERRNVESLLAFVKSFQ
ncbi:unnamed protein product [Calypogeia fissa]